jgi:hypothetical protein
MPAPYFIGVPTVIARSGIREVKPYRSPVWELARIKGLRIQARREDVLIGFPMWWPPKRQEEIATSWLETIKQWANI